MKKYYVGISGHRNLKKSELSKYKKDIVKILKEIIKNNPNKEIVALSPLADGADRLFIYAAKELGLNYEVLLPMPIKYYKKDFDNDSFKEFVNLLKNAKNSKIIDLSEGCSYLDIQNYGKCRDKQYQKMGYALSKISNELIFLWDGIKQNPILIGGTEDILNYTKQNKKKFNIVKCQREGIKEE